MTREETNESQTSEPQPEENPRDKFFRLMNKVLEKELQEHSVTAALGPVPAPTAVPTLADSYDNLDPETKKAIDQFIDNIRPDIEKKAVDLLLFEIRDKIARTGNINKIVAALKKGKKPQLKRKKGCLFIQLGSGDPNDEIEEFIVAST